MDQPTKRDKNNQEMIEAYKELILSLEQGKFDTEAPSSETALGQIGKALDQLKNTLYKKDREARAILRVKDKINTGVSLDQILDSAFEAFREIIPYNRIGFALLEEGGTMVRAHWSRSDAAQIVLNNDYCAPLNGSSLEKIVQTGEPRIINDLEEYLKDHPHSESTKKILKEGMRSSLTCPLFVKGESTGFLFFSSMEPQTYKDIHIDLFRTIAEQISMTLEKGRLYQELEQLNELKNKLLGIAAHDLRNPIGVIRGFSGFLADGTFGEVSENQKKYLQRIIKNCNHMLELIDDLLEISMIESGKLELKLTEVDIPSYLKEFQEYGAVMAAKKDITLELSLPEDMPKVVLDPQRINQVMNNLLSNAIKYSYPKTKVTIKAMINDCGELELSVKDQGQGIPKEDIPLLFMDYSKGSTRPTAGEKSSGLGLAIVRRIVNAHQGKLDIQSEPGKGSAFIFKLPLKGPSDKTSRFKEL